MNQDRNCSEDSVTAYAHQSPPFFHENMKKLAAGHVLQGHRQLNIPLPT